MINEEKRNKFIDFAGKRVNNVLHDIQILEPMARSNNYDFTRADVDAMFNAMQETLNEARAEKKVFSFGAASAVVEESAQEAVAEEAPVEESTENTSSYNTQF